MKTHTTADPRRTSFSWRAGLCFIFYIVISFLLQTFVCDAKMYRWIDQDGATHFSNIPSDDALLQEELAHQQIYEKRKNSVLYQDKFFKIVLMEERDDSLSFEVSYKNISRLCPDIFIRPAQISLSVGSEEPKGTYLTIPIKMTAGNNNTTTLTSKMTRFSESTFETDVLHFSVYQKARQDKKLKIIFERRIPFKKVWVKSSDKSKYQP